MQLNRVVVQLRQRTVWQSLDLGILLAQRWYGALFVLWLIGLLALLPLLLAVAFWLPTWALLVCFVLVQPLPEILPLFWMGRALFGERLSLKETLIRFWAQLRFSLLLRLALSRLSAFRYFVWPVLLLEAPGPGTLKARIALLGRGRNSGAFFPLLALLMTLLLALGALMSLSALIPDELGLDPDAQHIAWICGLLYALAAALLGPFWAACGFMVYISRRVELEAWDLELGLRALNARLRREIRGKR